MSKMTREEYLESMRAKTKNGIKSINKILEEIDSFNESIGNYSPEYASKLNLELQDKLRDAKKEAADSVNNLTELYKWEVEQELGLNPKDITPDIELLKTGLSLSERDINIMLHKAEGNLTMTTLISRYAHERGIGRFKDSGPDPIAIALQDASGYADLVAECSHMALKWSVNPHAYDSLLGEGSRAEELAQE